MDVWYKKYVGLPFKHLGNDPKTGIDCFNLCRYILQKETDSAPPNTTDHYCKIVDDDWYNKTNERLFLDNATKEKGWHKVKHPSVFDIIVMRLGSTNTDNHCAMYIDNNKILHTMEGYASWVAPYGRYYKQYTTGIWKWKNTDN